MEVVGSLPVPGKPPGPADVAVHTAFAYGAGSSIVVLEVQQFRSACALHGGHQAPVTAVKWCPAQHSRNFKQQSHLRLASGDSEGGVLVWDVLTASPIARLQDVPAAREIIREYAAKINSTDTASTAASNAAAGSAAATGVTSLAWVLPGSQTLAVVLSPALLLLWDVTSGAVLWRRELSTSMSECFTHLAVAPSDSRQLCLCGSSGALVVLQLNDPARDKVKVQQYRVNMQDGNTSKPQGLVSNSSSTLQALFAISPGLLLLLLPRELVVFDLELGQPAASTPLPPGRPAYSQLLGVFGSGVCQGGGDEGGLDFVYCTHVDGSLSMFVRVPGELRFKLVSNTRLVPPPVKGANNQVTLTVVKACLLKRHQQDTKPAQTASTSAAITRQLSASLSAMHLTREAPQACGAAEARSGGAVSSTNSRATAQSGHSLLVLAVTSDGRAWQWQVGVPYYPKRSFLTNSDSQPITAINATLQSARAAAAPTTAPPQLVGLLHGLPGSITATSFQSQPLMLACHSTLITAKAKLADNLSNPADLIKLSSPGKGAQHQLILNSDLEQHEGRVSTSNTADNPAAAECVVIGAAATSTGHIQVFSLRRGLVNPVSVEVCWSHIAHRGAVHGVRWLGGSPLLLSFSSEKAGAGVWKNSLMLTDVRTGQSVPFRNNVGSESSPMLGVRVSPTGTYLLLLLKDAPCELWTTAAKQDTAAGVQQGVASIPRPWRVRLLDLPFSAVEWVAARDDSPKVVNIWASVADDLASQMYEAAAIDGAGSDEAGCLQSPPQPQSAERQQKSKRFTRTLSALASPSMSVAGDAALDLTMPSELLVFGLRDGRAGVLSVRGRKVTDTRPPRPSNSPAPGDSVASAIAAVGQLVVLGDADGTLLAWDKTTGTCSALATGCGAVRRLHLSHNKATDCIRLAVLFTGGQFGVYEVDAAGRVRQTTASPALCARLGRALDVSWINMPGQLGSNSFLSVVLLDGSLCIVDVSQSAASQHSPSARRAAIQYALSTPSTCRCSWVMTGGAVTADRVPVVLMSPQPLGSSVLLRQSWVMLLRFLIQAGVSQEALLYLSSSSTEEDEDVSKELMMMLPRSARATLAQIAAQAQQRRDSSNGQLSSSDQAHAAADAAQYTPQPAPELVKAMSSSLLKSNPAASQAGAVMQSSSARSLSGANQQQQHEQQPHPTGKSGSPTSSKLAAGFGGDLVKLLRNIAKVRGSKQLLHADEWQAYSEALTSGLVARRMAVAADMTGDQDEARFWSHLPPTLTAVKALHTAIQIKQQQQAAAAGTSGAAGPQCYGSTPEAPTPGCDEQQYPGDEADVDTVSDYDRMVQQAVQGAAAATDGSLTAKAGSPAAGSPLSRRGSIPGRVRCSSGPEQLMTAGLGGAIKVAAAGRAVRLWDDELVLSDAQERLLWHEALPGQASESEGALELRLLEYVVLGDFATAVAFLLSAPPESSVSYYRSVVCALALAATASLRAQSSGSNKSMQAAATLHLQAAKVASAHAASIGDNLLGVPLNCSAGLDADAVTLLQEAGLWRHAAVLTARALSGTERAQALSTWSNHVLHREGSVWRCVGILATAGCLSAAAQVLRAAELPDAAYAFVQACQQAGLCIRATDATQQPQQQLLPSTTMATRDSIDEGAVSGHSDDQSNDHAEQQQSDLMLFDLLGQRTKMLSLSSSNLINDEAAVPNDLNKPMTGPEELASITTEYHQYLCRLMSNL